jgi:hypothetical protein
LAARGPVMPFRRPVFSVPPNGWPCGFGSAGTELLGFDFPPRYALGLSMG